jgi:histidine triad (HIT) family protein
MSNDCIFCKIIAGELPSTKIYEDETVLSLMDINPVEEGHALVIPKEHLDPITNVPDNILKELIVVAKKIAAAQFKALNASGVNIAQANGTGAGQEVPHIHFHIIPRYSTKSCNANWKTKKYKDVEQMNHIAELIKKAL